VVLAKAVVERDYDIDSSQLQINWLEIVKRERQGAHLWRKAISLERNADSVRDLVFRSRAFCEEMSAGGSICNAYGGHYFSPTQALTLDCMLQLLPSSEPERSVCLAATIVAASKSVAAPGHTAQPFQPTERASKFINGAWRSDPLLLAQKALTDICPRYARITGEALVSDALDVASNLNSDDLVIIDPPYSGVQYSRFYHVLETIARGYCGSVTGIGRYPPIEERPQSDFSKRSRAKAALETLVSLLADAGACAIFTFPAGECSNGLSGEFVIETAKRFFDIDTQMVEGRFSTLGGNNIYRVSRSKSKELLLFMRPR
jgi:hypothetical protein